MTATSKTYAICGAIRMMGESDDCIARLAKKDGILSKYVLNLKFYGYCSNEIFFPFQNLLEIFISLMISMCIMRTSENKNLL